jgi:hypothetical protein
MANSEHIELLRRGVDAWNAWRKKEPATVPDLAHAKLSTAHLRGAALNGANLRAADLSSADLRGAILKGAVLFAAILRQADHSDPTPRSSRRASDRAG